MQLVRYSPLREMQKMEQDLDKFWQNGWGSLPAFTETSTMDMYEENGNLVAEVSLPNFKKDEVKVTTDEGMLEVSAEHKEEEEKKGKRRYFFRESSNQYLRRVALPEGVKADKADASFKDGVLKVAMPMATQKTAKAIAVK
jgi:HSP20 family protein